jgi:uncharacterized peroxidase-related enzyme
MSQQANQGQSSSPETTGKPISWLRLPEAPSLEPAVRALHKECLERLGYVRNFLKLPFGPDRLALYQGYLDRLMRSSDARLPGIERELLALVVSTENRCEVCVMSHATALRKHGMDPFLVDSITIAWRRAELEPRHRALAEFASKLTAHPAEADESYIEELRSAGFTEEEIFEAAQIVSIYNSNNRLNNALGLRPNEEARVSFRAG